MTTEEKAQCYDKALERAKKLQETCDSTAVVGWCEYIFPELKESEDERILEIIKHCIESRYLHTSTIKGISQKECFAWLEKQKPITNKEDEEVRQYLIRTMKRCDINVPMVQKALAWLEKQRKDKEMNNFDVLPGLYKCVHRMFDGTPDGKLLFEVGNIYKCLSKHDRAEFEVSYGHSVYLEDPVVCKHFIPYEKQGEQKVSYTTTVETGDGGINALVTRDIEIPFGAKDSELQEATYFIPKGYYAKVEGDKVVIKKGEQTPVNKVKQKFKVGDSIKTTNEEPLTITKIDGKGYWSEDLFICGFDAAAKWELVEQKPADKVKPKFNVGDIIKITGINNGHTGYSILNTEDGYYYNWKLVEYKPAWSEEDNKWIENLIQTFEELF